jgi:hypothetical protein
MIDFCSMVLHSFDDGRTPVNLRKLARLGEKVWPGGGGDEILRLVEEAKRGEVPRVSLK